MELSFMNRDFQRKILEELANHYPDHIMLDPVQFGRADDRDLVKAIKYLGEHGLLTENCLSTFSGVILGPSAITCSGLDFLQDDGGMGAILGVLTIKIHEDQFKEILIRKIDNSDAEESVKSRMKKAVEELPADATKQLAGKVIDWGSSNLSAIWSAIREFGGHLADSI